MKQTINQTDKFASLQDGKIIAVNGYQLYATEKGALLSHEEVNEKVAELEAAIELLRNTQYTYQNGGDFSAIWNKNLKKKPKDTGYDPELVVLPFEGDNFKNAWVQWCMHRKEKKQKLTPTTVKLQLDLLSKHPEKIAIGMIMQSISNGWMGLFDLKPYHPLLKELSQGKMVQSAQTIKSAASALFDNGLIQTAKDFDE